jgi:spermidine synthase
MPVRLLAVALLSTSLLAYQVALLRAFSIALGYHFAYLIISIAMLGYGASGTILALLRPGANAAQRAFPPLALSTALAQVVGLGLALRLPFEPFLILWEPARALPLFGFYLLLGLPYALGASALALALITAPLPGRIYFADLTGAGLGAGLVILLLYRFPPVETVGLIALASALSAVVAASRLPLRLAAVVVGLLLLPATARLVDQKSSPYKGISTAILLPRAERSEPLVSPLGVVEAVSSPAVRYAPGLSLSFQGSVPEQVAIFTDGDQAGTITRPASDLTFLDHLTAALPYHLLSRPSVLVLGAGGGMEVLSALNHGASQVVAVELDPNVIELVDVRFQEFSGSLYRNPKVEVVLVEARRFLETTDERFDLISLALLDSFFSSSTGVQAAAESYLYTVESLAAAINRLTPGGILAITRWIKTPPRDVPRTFATAVAALERLGVQAPGTHLAGIRSWATATLLITNTPFTPAELERLEAFCEERSFDRFWHTGLTASETNRFHVLPQEFYAEAARRILSPSRQEYIAGYPFRIDPPTDDRPYFFHFFRWGSLIRLTRELGLEWIPFVEWGYLILIAVLVQAALASAVLILGPLLVSPSLRLPPAVPRGRVAIYFASLGLGFLFLEVAFIQRLVLFLSHPVTSVTTVIAALLVSSGLGSLLGRRIRLRPVTTGIAVLVLAYLIGLPFVLGGFFEAADAVRTLIAIIFIAPLGFLMGIPFPRGISILAERAPALAPWAWAVNGCASVLAPPLATLLAMGFGFRVVLATAAGLYLLAGWALAEGSGARPDQASL